MEKGRGEKRERERETRRKRDNKLCSEAALSQLSPLKNLVPMADTHTHTHTHSIHSTTLTLTFE